MEDDKEVLTTSLEQGTKELQMKLEQDKQDLEKKLENETKEINTKINEVRILRFISFINYIIPDSFVASENRIHPNPFLDFEVCSNLALMSFLYNMNSSF